MATLAIFSLLEIFFSRKVLWQLIVPILLHIIMVYMNIAW